MSTHDEHNHVTPEPCAVSRRQFMTTSRPVARPDGANMRITNHAGASQYLTRKYRQPYTL